jgi:hypothetical protein
MNTLRCHEAQERLDLLAADACDPAVRAALERHLHECPACAATHGESRRLVGLLDLRWNEAAIARLQRRIELEARPVRRLRLFSPAARRVLAAAAMFLVTIGLMWSVPKGDQERGGAEQQFALLVQSGKQAAEIDQQPARGKDFPPALLKGNEAEAMIVKAPGQRTGNEFRSELKQAQREGKLPPPSPVSLELALVNKSQRPMEIRIGEATPILSLDVQGEGVVRLSAPGAEPPDFLRPRLLRLEPGESSAFHVDRLIEGSPGALEYIYMTEPGEYLVTARLRLLARGQIVTVTGRPARIWVAK